MFEGGKRETLLKLYPSREKDIQLFGFNTNETNMPKGFAT